MFVLRLAVLAFSCSLGGMALAQGPVEFPLRANDLASNERYSTFVHTAGIQAEGKDIGAQRHRSDKDWTGFKTDQATDRKVLANWLVYGKPFYAMAPGKVVACWRNAPDNEPGSYHPDYEAGKIPSSGNHLWILQDDGVYVLYAHARPGSISSKLCPHEDKLLSNTATTNSNPHMRIQAQVTNGARVEVGDKLGEVGNTGQSESGPHLHVHMEKDGKPVPMRFKRGMSTPFTNDTASLDGPWTRTAGNALPAAKILVWAPHRIGNYTFNGVPSENYQRMVDHLADSWVMPNLITCASNGATYNSTWVPKEGEWATHHGMNAAAAASKQAEYTSKGYTRTSSYTCGSVSVAVWKK